MLWHAIEQSIQQATTNSAFKILSTTPVGGGCINDAYIIGDQTHRYFVKTNHASLIDMFESEMTALVEIERSNSLRVPRALTYGSHESTAYLVLEHLTLQSAKINNALLGEQLARMHQHTQQSFGWMRDNTIGSTPQKNQLSTDWPTFWQDQRLAFQLSLAASNGFGGKLQQRGEQLCLALHHFFNGYTPQASLLHGDLWSGNYSSLADGTPVIFDPATYYGDRETDIAMTELFGGFSPRFYDAYQAHYPLDSAYQTRKTLYNLYHILNHVNLFGSSYLNQAESMINRLLAEVS